MQSEKVDKMLLRARQKLTLLKPDGSPVKNQVTSVRRFEESFPDLNDVQLATAERVGISHIENRSEAQKRMDDLVYIGDNPFYNVQKLNLSGSAGGGTAKRNCPCLQRLAGYKGISTSQTDCDFGVAYARGRETSATI